MYIYDIDTKKLTYADITALDSIYKPCKHHHACNSLQNVIVYDSETCVLKNGESGWIVSGQFCIDGIYILVRTLSEVCEVFSYIDTLIEKSGIKNSARTKQTVQQHIYVHNLGYDMYFIKDKLNQIFDDDVSFFGGQCKPISCEISHLKFRDSLILFDCKLEKLAVDYNLKYRKTCDWDYTKIRTPCTKLSESEVYYAICDVAVLYESILIKVKEYSTISKIPATKTSEVRYYKKYVVGNSTYKFDNFEKCKEYVNNRLSYIKVYDISKVSISDVDKSCKIPDRLHITKNLYYHSHKLLQFVRNKNGNISHHEVTLYEFDSKYIKYVKKQNSDFELSYRMSVQAFAGGFTHANRKHLGEIAGIDCTVDSYDLTSAYPAELLLQKFCLQYHKADVHDFYKYVDKKNLTVHNENIGFLAEITFHDLQATHDISVLSASKCIDTSTDKSNETLYNKHIEEIDNGRIIKASECTFVLSDIDIKYLMLFYTWSKETVHKLMTGKKEYLTQTEIQTINHFYCMKTQLKEKIKVLKKEYDKTLDSTLSKQIEQLEFDLMLAKQRLNSIYGCIATNRLNYLIDIDDLKEQGLPDAEITEIFADKETGFYTAEQKRADTATYEIGQQVTAYVRCRILTTVARLGYISLLYSDTDSIKCKRTVITKSIFDSINRYIIETCKKAAVIHSIDLKDWETSKGIAYIGIFDYETSYKYFKTLGAKRYIYVDKYEYETALKNQGTKDKTGHKITVFDSLHCTVAGIPKLAMKSYLTKNVKSIIQVFYKFDRNLEIKETESRKKVCKRIKSDLHTIRYDNCDIECASYIYLYDTTFKMSVADDVYNSILAVLKLKTQQDLLINAGSILDV